MDAPIKVALITGAGKDRIGREIARFAARRGYHVAIHYNHAKSDASEAVAEMSQFGVQAEAFQADVADESAVRKMVEAVGKRFGRIDLLATCAAVWDPCSLEDAHAEDVLQHFKVNTLGTFLCCKYAGLLMTAQPTGGAIVTFGDWATARPYLEYPAYFVSKGSIPTLTRMFAVELAARNPRVRVNCIEPGPAMVPESIQGEERLQIADTTLLKRLGTPEHVASAVLFFAENDFITGTCLPIDGGRTLSGS